MKRCPQCNRVETDEALKFRRVDGTTLVNDSGAVSGDVGTPKFVSGAVSSETETSVLPHRTDAEINRPTAKTTVGYVLGTAYHANGQYGEAIAEFRKALALSDDPWAKALLARSLAKAGQRNETFKLLGELESESARRYVASSGFAVIYAALGDKDRALVWLEREVAERSPRPPLFAVNPVFDDFRDDARFKDLLHRVELAKTD